MPLLCQRSSISDNLFELVKLTDFSATADFDCEDPDLNDFFQSDAPNYKSQLLAETYAFYLLEDKKKKIGPLAFVALANDVIKLSGSQKERLIHKDKRYLKVYPAVKIARLGVNKRFKRKGVGTSIVNLLKVLFTTENRTGCRFVTVDAYNKEPVLAFYEKNEFEFLRERGSKQRTRIMFYDLKRFEVPKGLRTST
ncbi:MAG: GNAT family N-acetyltransferase [Deltaproteobacteria bacterium]|jgi:GNAT superfamily N-acetyltransferase|nr:GNAT family N-acetyltransferase [Deltaproteobacteria bacterium]MBW2566236.1 GNAT family N-acetyltransferase [Deltaproteobacteria bacterium]